jgi:hypothetical protein
MSAPIRVATRTAEFAGDLPILEEQQPFRRPRDDCRGDRIIGRPNQLLGVVKAQRWPFRISVVAVNVRQEPSFLECFRADGRIDYVDRDEWILECPAIEKHSRKVDDTNPVGLTSGFDWALPNTDPSGVCRQFEIREIAPDEGVLFSDA